MIKSEFKPEAIDMSKLNYIESLVNKVRIKQFKI